MNLYCVTQTEATNSKNSSTSLVLAQTAQEAAREFVRDQRSVMSSLLVLDLGIHGMLFVTPCLSSLDAAGIASFSPLDAQFVPFNRDWLMDQEPLSDQDNILTD